MIMSEYWRRLRVFAPVPAPDLSSSFGSTRDTWIAGTRPTMTTHTTHATIANANIRQLVCGAITHSATLGGMCASSSVFAQNVSEESEREARDGEQSRSRASNCAMMSRRDAPSAVAQRELAAAADPARELQVGEVGAGDEQHGDAPHRSARSGNREMELRIRDRLRRNPAPLGGSPAAARARPKRRDSSSIVGCACLSVMPARRRAMLAGSALSGAFGARQHPYVERLEPGTCDARSITPMIGCDTPSMLIVEPTGDSKGKSAPASALADDDRLGRIGVVGVGERAARGGRTPRKRKMFGETCATAPRLSVVRARHHPVPPALKRRRFGEDARRRAQNVGALRQRDLPAAVAPHAERIELARDARTSTRGLIIASSTLYIVVLSAIARPSDTTATMLNPR